MMSGGVVGVGGGGDSSGRCFTTQHTLDTIITAIKAQCRSSGCACPPPTRWHVPTPHRTVLIGILMRLGLYLALAAGCHSLTASPSHHGTDCLHSRLESLVSILMKTLRINWRFES